MTKNTWWGKTLRFIGILLMGITALFTIAGGLGTTCVALNPTGFGESMAKLESFQWLYILFVIVTTAIGIMAARAVFLLARGKSNSYRASIFALVLGIVVGVIHMLVSRGLRGSSMPVDGVVYTTVLTLIVFLLFRIPKIWEGIGFTNAGSNDKTGTMSAAITLLITGILTLTVQYWAGPTHTWDGTNWAAAFLVTSIMLGIGQILGGAAILLLKEKADVTVNRPIAQD
jgi:hypothetical protein